MALPAYRSILRATKLAFANDIPLLHASREQARATFSKNGALLTAGTPEATAQIEHAQAVARVLRRNVVQGERVDAAGMEGIEGGGPGSDGTWKLRLHRDIERGDNESVKRKAAPMADAAA